MKNKNTKTNNAITLISLVITIIVLIILASVAIYLSLGDNGIFVRSKQAKEETNKQTATDIINLKITNCQMNKYAEEQRMPTLKELSLSLGTDNEIQYVTEQSRKQARTEYDISSENPSSIFTKLNKYPYEFEINSRLQLASIDGVKIASSITSSNTPPNSQNTMSGEEHFTGEYYFNGKPIYEKTIYISSLPNNAEKSYENNIKDVDVIWINTSKTFVTFPDTVTAPIYYAAFSFENAIVGLAHKDKVRIRTKMDRSDCTAYITLNYTKITDSGSDNTITPTPAN